jgi:hypothetical protein
MKPEADQILGLCVQSLHTVLMPELHTAYPQVTAAIMGLLMAFAAQEYERGAEIRVTENARMRALFADLAPLVRDGALKVELETASTSHDASLLISTLNESNAALRHLLIALHAHVESLDGAREAEKKIWALLAALAERRLLKLPS